MQWSTLGKLALEAFEEPDPKSLVSRALALKEKVDEACDAVVLAGFLIAPDKEVLQS